MSTDWFEQWATEGYIRLQNVIDRERIAALRPVCDRVLSQFLVENPETGEPGDVDGRVLRKLEHPAYHEDDVAGRLLLMETFADPAILQIVGAVLGQEGQFRSSSYWYEPVNIHRDGNWHRDIQFVKPDLAEQRAFIDSQPPQTGVQLMLPLVPSSDSEYVPGSHLRWDTTEEHRIRWEDEQRHSQSNDMPGAVRLHVEPGDIVSFNPMGLHRGRYHSDKKRRTIMLTYTTAEHGREDYFSYAPWYLDDGFLDGLSPKARAFYQQYIDRFQDFWSKPRQCA